MLVGDVHVHLRTNPTLTVTAWQAETQVSKRQVTKLWLTVPHWWMGEGLTPEKAERSRFASGLSRVEGSVWSGWSLMGVPLQGADCPVIVF